MTPFDPGTGASAPGREVLVITGMGGMGLAVARRVGSGRSLLVADVDPASLEEAVAALRAEGHDVTARQVDVSDADAVAGLADAAAGLGPVRYVVHTAGLSPVQASAEAIIRVDLLGVAFVLEELARVISPGGSGVVVASMAAHIGPPLSADEERLLTSAPARELGTLPCVGAHSSGDSGAAYAFAKRAALLRVRSASPVWAQRRARINSISPGIVSTRMGLAELAGPLGPGMRSFIAGSAAKRLGTPDDVAAAVEFLLGPQSSFVAGTDLLVDGGAVAALVAGSMSDPVA